VDPLDVLILALRLLFVALLYAFLVVVLRLAIGGLRAPPAPVEARSRRELKLVVLEPGASSLRPGEVIAVADGSTLGRGDRADVVLSDSAVSAEHARVDRVGRGWVVIDLGSTNGTRVNDAVVRTRTSLNEGDVLTVGTVRLQVAAR
jgi:hypothetical protein